MGKFDIKTIVGHLAENPLLYANRYEVVISGPVPINSHMMFNCSQAGIPGYNIASFEYSLAGPKRKIPNEETYDDLSLTFYNGTHMYELTAIHDWMKLIAGSSTYHLAYYNDIVADINIGIYDLNERRIAEVKFAEAYPIGMSEVELGYAVEAPSTLTVNFTYHTYDFKVVND